MSDGEYLSTRGKAVTALGTTRDSLIAVRCTGAPEPQERLAGRRICPDEELLSLAETSRRLPKIDGKKVAISTIFRWCTNGLRKQRLPYVRIGKRIFVTRHDLLEFFRTLSEHARRIPPETSSQQRVLKRCPITSRQRERALAAADEILERAKI